MQQPTKKQRVADNRQQRMSTDLHSPRPMARASRRRAPPLWSGSPAWHLAPREGWCYHHVQAIIVAIDQYAEAALGNREFFLNKPYGIGGRAKDNIP